MLAFNHSKPNPHATDPAIIEQWMADNPERVQIIPERPPQPRKPHKVISPYLMGYDVLPRSTEPNRHISPTKAKREAWLAHMRATGTVMTDLQVCDSFKIKCPLAVAKGINNKKPGTITITTRMINGKSRRVYHIGSIRS